MSDTRENDVRNCNVGLKVRSNFKHGVFLVFKSSDIDKISHVASALRSYSIRCIYDNNDHKVFPIGQIVFKSIVEGIENSEKTLLLLSRNSIDSTWVLLETVLALEQSKKRNELTLRIVLNGVNEHDIPFLKREFLASVPHRTLDFNKEGWEERLANYVKEDIQLPDILPVGSLAHGLVFSHFIGYYRYVLPELRRRLQDHPIYRNNPGRVSTKYYLLLPSSCKVEDSLAGTDVTNKISIEKETKLMIEVHHSGKPREIYITVYSIKKEGEEPFYFFADCPNVLNAIYTMSVDTLAKVDIPFHVARFYYTMNEVINHTLNKDCNGVVELLRYNDSTESRECVLYEAIKRTLCTTDSVTKQILHRDLPPQTSQPQTDVTILCHPDCEKDLHIAETIATYLEKKGFKVKRDFGAEGANETVMKIAKAKWYIFVISRNTLDFTDTTARKCITCLQCSISDDSLCVLPVLVDVEPRELPSLIKWVTLISANDPSYCDVILQTISGQPIKMQYKIPCGDIATGLAWAAYINYLSIIMKPGIHARIVQLLQRQGLQCGCIEKLFIIVPSSCKTETSLHEKANEKSIPPPIDYVGKTEPLEKNMAGQHRTFYLHMYKYTDQQKKQSVCFMAEYCASINCLFEMSKLQFAGLTREDMERQCRQFVCTMTDIMNRKAVKDRLGDISHLVEFVFYEDTKKTLLNAIHEQIIQKHNTVITADGNRNTA
ncbi:uncharacterized protein LOC123554296 [Mercenaria mercenaria]|uniref:uncharacterized protein LOC123554296 n=1 Tax=Mercenaria mercenaria TaxID=6596 RepID=UPI00234FA96C|nr:uncharacterized protein LOC123554296 [Mercenaria mercenaria]